MEGPPEKLRKRVREACEPCRRKKGRCPGEKPTCSLCARLGQTCTYAGSAENVVSLGGTTDLAHPDEPRDFPPVLDRCADSHSVLAAQVGTIDGKLTEVLDCVRSISRSSLPQITPYDSAAGRPPSAQDELVPPTSSKVREAARLYLKFCHCQPLCLFSATALATSLLSCDIEVRICVIGLTGRFAPSLGQNSAAGECRKYLDHATRLVLKKVEEGACELSTLQCMCMLALSEFHGGSRHRAGIFVCLAAEVCRTARLDSILRSSKRDPRTEEYVRAFWSVVMLQYWIGTFGVISTNVDSRGLRYPLSDSSNDPGLQTKQNEINAQQATADLGVIAYTLQMSEAWYKTRQFVYHRGRLDVYPPWSEKSIYSQIMFRQMELESQMPSKHRFKPSGFAELFVAEVSSNRNYWAPWLLLQIMYHTIVCTLNHPILLSIHLRRFKVNQIPELFLQQTADMIASHTDWMIHLLELAKEKDFRFSDPFLGQCVAIVATIFLQQSYTEDHQVRQDKQGKFSFCLSFVRDLGKYWPLIAEMANDLEVFERTVTRAYEASSSQNLPNLSRHVDLTAFWKILDNTLPMNSPQGDQTMLGPSLSLKATARLETDMLSTRLLPEPTRVNSLFHTTTPASSTPIAKNGSDLPSGPQNSNPGMDLGFDFHSDSPFLAQNFFALGQDFVGNVDDWFSWDDG